MISFIFVMSIGDSHMFSLCVGWCALSYTDCAALARYFHGGIVFCVTLLAVIFSWFFFEYVSLIRFGFSFCSVVVC